MIKVHSCGETHVFENAEFLFEGDKLSVTGESGRATFQVWDWWREIEEDSDGSEG